MKRGFGRLFGAALGVAGLTAAGTAEAGANVSISGPVISSITSQDRQQTRYSVNYTDCVGDAKFEFPLAIKNATGANLQVWIGEASDCTQKADRNSMDPSKDCRQVTDLTAKSGKYTITAHEIATALRAIDDSCTDSMADTTQHKATLYFLLIRAGGDGNVAADDVESWTQTIVDVVPPTPPTDLSLGLGEGQLTVKYTASSDGEKKGYYFYCDPLPSGITPTLGTGGAGGTSGVGGTAPLFLAAGGAGGAGGATGTGGAMGTGGATGAGGAMGAGGATGTGGAMGTGGATGTTSTSGVGGAGSSSCPSTVLIPGSIPPPEYLCGDSQDPYSTQKVLEDLQNGQIYTIGIATYDLVRNASPLSEVVCDTPVSVTDFWESYCSQGGAACVECGVCTVGATPYEGSTWLSLGGGGLAALGLVLRRMRRKKTNAKRGGPEGV